MYLYKMKVRRIERGEPLGNGDHPIHRIPYQRFQTIEEHYPADREAFSGFANRIAEMNSRILGGADKPCLIALPMWIKRQSIGGVTWHDVLKDVPKKPIT